MSKNLIVYESNDTTFLPIIEQALKDHNIPFTTTGGADVGVGLGARFIRIFVEPEFVGKAKAIIEQVSL